MAQADRHRKMVTVTLSDSARARLDELSAEYGSKSAAIEALIRQTESLKNS